MDTLLRDPQETIASQELDRFLSEVPTGILTHEPERADPGAEHVWPEVSGDVTPTYLHGGVVVTVAAGYAWFLLAFWAAFWGFGYMMFTMVVVTLISGTMLTFPMSIAPPATAAATAVPLFIFSIRTSSPAWANIPALCA